MSDESNIISLLDPADARHFHVGWRTSDHDRHRHADRWIRRTLWKLTRWWRPRSVCTAVDVEAGTITLDVERWSWRRWRWERVAP